MMEEHAHRPITDDMLTRLAASLATKMSPKRYAHTLGVEQMAIRLGALYCPDQIPQLRAAALLHDITKEETLEKQLQLCQQFGIIVEEMDCRSPKIFHAKTAAALIERQYPDYADPIVIGAVRWHTTGRAGMTQIEQLIYLADYIDDTRTFADCVTLRDMFWGADPAAMPMAARVRHLHVVLLASYDMTIRALLDEKVPIDEDTFRARNDLLLRLC